MRNVLIATTATLLVATPAAAQRQPTPEQRIERVERQVRQLQRQVFPKGQPADTAGFSDEPAATQTVVVAQSNRIDNLERQLVEITRIAEESSNRVATLEAEVARLRAELDGRLRRLETGNAAAGTGAAAADAPADTQAAATEPATPEPAAEEPRATPVRTATRPASPAGSSFVADGEAAYDEGYQLWLQKRYPQAIAALRAMASSFPGHRRVSWANNLAGRALLDSGQPRAAAEALLANYRSNPKGERAADSLFYLGQALMALKQPTQACKAYAELEEVYGATMRAELRRLLPEAKTRAGC